MAAAWSKEKSESHDLAVKHPRPAISQGSALCWGQREEGDMGSWNFLSN